MMSDKWDVAGIKEDSGIVIHETPTNTPYPKVDVNIKGILVYSKHNCKGYMGRDSAVRWAYEKGATLILIRKGSD